MDNYESVKQELRAMLEELDTRLERITNDVKHLDEPIEQDFAEQITQNENNEVLDGLGNATRNEIAAIKHAITRIDKGEYSICQTCGENIQPERLKAIPYSTLCIKCAS